MKLYTKLILSTGLLFANASISKALPKKAVQNNSQSASLESIPNPSVLSKGDWVSLDAGDQVWVAWVKGIYGDKALVIVFKLRVGSDLNGATIKSELLVDCKFLKKGNARLYPEINIAVEGYFGEAPAIFEGVRVASFSDGTVLAIIKSKNGDLLPQDMHFILRKHEYRFETNNCNTCVNQ
jgi:hypothetical protein